MTYLFIYLGLSAWPDGRRPLVCDVTVPLLTSSMS